MNRAGCNGSPQAIPLQQLPYANEAKPQYSCKAFLAQCVVLISKQVLIYGVK